jgi:acyl carrier protein
MTVEKRTMKVFKEVLEIKDDVDPAELKYNHTANWTSLAHIALVSALESEFDILIDTDDIIAMSSYEKAVEIVRKNYHGN